MMEHHHVVDDLLADLRDLEAALDDCDDGAKATRLRLMLASRQRQLDALRRRDR
jgi:hypothetical protein